MIRCPGCSYLVPEAWEACRRCGAVLAPRPAPVGAGVVAPAPPTDPAPPGAAPAAALAAPGRVRPARPAPVPAGPARPAPRPPTSRAEPDAAAAAPPVAFDLVPSRFEPGAAPTAAPGPGAAPGAPGPAAPAPRGPNDLLPIPDPYRPRRPEPPPPRDLTRYRKPALAALAALVVAAWAYVLWPRGGTGTPGTEVLSDAGSGSPVADAWRVAAEATLARAITTVQAAAAEQGDVRTLTPTALGRYDPSLRYVPGDQPSPSTEVVSTEVAGGTVTLAVAGESGVCAFGRVLADGTVSKVTVRGDDPCAAAGAPATGWDGSAATDGTPAARVGDLPLPAGAGVPG
ncbi:MAG: hypothetical protein KatS3mg009_2594 [Acidimicrobiia bacterium]|nr:MAG: hypothetical protein KatS3mg009_2594 [Acidimicrobiia bacterium]